MSIKLSGLLPLAAYAVQTKVTASLQAKSNTAAKSSPAVAMAAKSTSVATATKSASVATMAKSTSVATIYTSDKQVVTNTGTIGSKLDVSVTATTPSSGSIGPSVATTAPNTSSSISSQTLTPNEQILLAKQLYDNAQKLGSQAGMATASELADQARQNGGTISSNVTLEQAKVMVANEQILKSKEEYDIALKAGNEAAMKTSSEQAAQARKNGGSISSNVTLEQAKVIVANEQIVQAKKDYAVAEKKEDKAAMSVAIETANKARQSGGTISSNVTLEYALKIMDQSKWNASDSSSPMDIISTEDEASLMKKARENASNFGMDEQIATLNRAIIDLNTAILTLEASNKNVKGTIESLKRQKEELQEDRKRVLELGKWIDALQEDIHSDLEATNKVITELSKLVEEGKLSSERGLKLAESIHGVSDEQRGTVLGEAMSGFFSGIWSSLDDTVDLVFFAFEDPQAAGKQTINGVGDTIQSLWDKLSDPKATYNDVEQSIKEFMELSDEEQAYTVGFLLSQLSPSRRADILNPMKNKDDGANGLEGNSSNGNRVEGAVKTSTRTQVELDALATDPAIGNKITPKTIAEREVGLGLEARGEVSGLVRDPSGKAEFIDSSGQKWDVKAFNSNFAPKGYNLSDAMTNIRKSISDGENVMLDARNLSQEHLSELKDELVRTGLINNVKIWPE
ncbi:MAG TPA: hypothetical protein IAA29_08020 [Candidatus Paenibacillus intestinavium]|nr:hypothetical protein [Candidatus Paenibacillus intestinavium]